MSSSRMSCYPVDKECGAVVTTWSDLGTRKATGLCGERLSLSARDGGEGWPPSTWRLLDGSFLYLPGSLLSSCHSKITFSQTT